MELLNDKKVKIAISVVLALCVTGVVIYLWHMGHKEEPVEASDEYTEITTEVVTTPTPTPPPKTESKIDFNGQKSKNKDIYAWIEIPGTPVNYPILQSAPDMKEDFYLDHNLDRSHGYPGCIYTQRRNKQDFSDPVTVMYGHNMKNDTMFGILNEYKKKKFFDEHNKIIVYTPDETINYRIFASHEYTNKLILGEYSDFTSLDNFKKFLEDIKSRAKSTGVLDESIAVGEGSKIITLSTCINDNNRRWLIQAVREDTIVGNQ